MMETLTQEQLYFKPATVKEAAERAIAHQSDFKYLAGGTDVMVNCYQETETAACLIDLTGIEELQTVEKSQDHLKIGAGVTLDELENHDIVRDEFPVLLEAARSVGSPLIRKSATLGGNILCENRCRYYNQSEFWRTAIGFCLKCDGDFCIATGGTKACFSKFVSDTAPALISMDAQLEMTGENGTTTVPLESIYSGDGIAPVTLEKTALIQHILLPLNRGFRSVFKKLRPREAVDFTSLTSVVTIDQNDRLTIALAGIDPKPAVVRGHHRDDPQALVKQCLRQARAVDNDVIFSRKYRRKMVGVFVRGSLEALGLDGFDAI